MLVRDNSLFAQMRQKQLDTWTQPDQWTDELFDRTARRRTRLNIRLEQAGLVAFVVPVILSAEQLWRNAYIN